MQTALVVGGTGFIGEYVVREMRLRGATVKALHHEDASENAKQDGVEYIRADIQNERLDFSDVGIVLWLAPPIAGLVEAALPSFSPNATFVYASTLLLYPDSDTPCTEGIEVAPLSDYEQSKYQDEEFLKKARTQMIIARLGNAYGDQKNRGIIGVVLRAARDNGTLDIQGDGSQERDFVHVEDAAASLAGLACAKISGHQVFNVCSGRSHSVNDVIEKIRRMSGAEILVRYEAKSEGKQRNGGDNRKIISELGVSFRDFDTGLQNAYLKYTLAR